MTEAYTRINDTFRAIAEENDLLPTDVRVLVAIRDQGGDVRSNDLSTALALLGTAQETTVRRALGTLYARQLAEGFGPGDGPRKPGYRTRIVLTDAGRAIADEALALCAVEHAA